MHLVYDYCGTTIAYLQKPLETTAGLGCEGSGLLTGDGTGTGQREQTVSSSREDCGTGSDSCLNEAEQQEGLSIPKQSKNTWTMTNRHPLP